MIELLIAPISALLSKVIPDTAKRDEIAFQIATLAEKQAHEQIIQQLEVNKQEAAHKSLFVAGWRPFIGWTCGVAMAFNFVAAPIITSVGYSVTPLELETMMPVLLGMLGLGGMRSYEKRNGVARER